MTFPQSRARAVAVALTLTAFSALSVACGSDVSGPFPPASISAVAGTSPQTATAGSAVATPPAIRVLDANGQPVQGITVTFTVTAGGGTVAGASPMTNANGIATVTSWTLGATVGTNTLSATTGNLAAVTFTATGVVGVAVQLTKTSADPQTAVVGTVVPAAPSVTVKDANGNPVAGVAVAFVVMSGGGTIVVASTASNAAGVATSGPWTLGTVPGANVLSASAFGLPAATFTAIGTVGPAASIVVSPTGLGLGVGGSQQLSASVSDQFGNVISGAPLSWVSAAPSIASVTNNGLVTGVDLGNTTITVASGTASKVVPVSVVAHPLGSTNTVIGSLPGRPFGIRVSSGNRVAVTQQDLNTITLFDVSGGGSRLTVPVGADPGEVVFNRTGSTAFVSGFNDGSITRVNVAAGTAGGSVTVGGNAYRLALSPDETRLYVSSTNGALYVVNPATPSVITSTAIAGSLQGLALSVNGQTLFVTSTSGTISRLAALTLVGNGTNALGGTPQDIAVTADQSEVFVANEVGWVDVLDGATLASKQRIPLAFGSPFGLAITPDESQVYVTATNPGRVIVLDRATRSVVRVFNVGGVPRRVTFTADGLTALIANESGWVDVIR
jgi:YVTN family beta-propeller protein